MRVVTIELEGDKDLMEELLETKGHSLYHLNLRTKQDLDMALALITNIDHQITTFQEGQN